MTDKKGATVDPRKVHVGLTFTPKSPAAKQRIVAAIPSMLDEYQTRKTAYRSGIVKLHTGLMPAVR